MAISNVTPVELASYIAGDRKKKTEYKQKERGKKNRKDPIFSSLVAYYSTSEDNVGKYVKYGKNR